MQSPSESAGDARKGTVAQDNFFDALTTFINKRDRSPRAAGSAKADAEVALFQAQQKQVEYETLGRRIETLSKLLEKDTLPPDVLSALKDELIELITQKR